MHALTGFTRAQVEELVGRHAEAGGQPGLVYGIVRDGLLLHAGGRGVARLGGREPGAATVFRIASMTKSFTAAAVLLLRDEGALRLDDDVVRYVPEAAALRSPADGGPPLTVRTLLTMTAGLPTDDPWGDRQQDLPDDEFARMLAGGLSFAWTPGTAYEYSNTGYALLGRVITAAAGRPYADVVAERLLGPLGLRSTVFTADAVPAGRLAQGYRPAPDGGWEEVPFAGHGAFASMGGLFSTLEDLAVWVGGFTTAFPHREGAPEDRPHPLSPASRRELQQPHRAVAPLVTWQSLARPPAVRGQAYGFGLVVEHDPVLGEIVGHGGGYPGFGTHMRWHPASGLGVVVLGNATYAPSGRLTGSLLDLLLAPAPRSDTPAPGRPGHAPRPPAADHAMTAATAAARADVDRLLGHWDDELAARVLASNVDQDEPLSRRRAVVERLRAELGPLEPEPGSLRSASPAHARWWLRGPGGRVRVEIRLTPEVPPRVQTLALTAVRLPPADVRELADGIAAALGGDAPELPAGWEPPPDAGETRRALRVAAAWAGRCQVTEVVSGDGECHAGFQLEGDGLSLVLGLTWVPGSRRLTSVTLAPAT